MNSLHNFLQLMTGGQNFILDIELCLTWGCGPVAPWPLMRRPRAPAPIRSPNVVAFAWALGRRHLGKPGRQNMGFLNEKIYGRY